MAQVNKIIPFILKWEAGISGPGTNEELFEKARKTGWADDPSDLGGQTMIGITLSTYTNYCYRKGYPKPTADRLKNISFQHWRDVLKTLFWDKWRADEIDNQSIASILFDWVWASGGYGIKLPQKILGVKQDGIVGPITIEAVNSRDPKELFEAIKAERIAFIDRICQSRPANNKFKNGWLNRINDIKFNDA